MLYAAKCYWPGVTPADLEQVAKRARAGPGTGNGSVSYLGALLFAADDLALCLFQGPSRTAVIQASERLGILSERLMDAAWLGRERRDAVPSGATRSAEGDPGYSDPRQNNERKDAPCHHTRT